MLLTCAWCNSSHLQPLWSGVYGCRLCRQVSVPAVQLADLLLLRRALPHEMHEVRQVQIYRDWLEFQRLTQDTWTRE